MDTKKWQSIGTVLGETNIDHFYFSLKNYKAKKGDIITTESKIPSSEGNVIPVTVWGKISSIESSNAFFPTEAAQELTNENIDIRDTILPMTRDELICKVIILGFTLESLQQAVRSNLFQNIREVYELTHPGDFTFEFRTGDGTVVLL